MGKLAVYKVGRIVSNDYDNHHSRIGLGAPHLSSLELHEVLKGAMEEASLKYPVLDGVVERNYSEKPDGEGCGLYEPVKLSAGEKMMEAQVFNAIGPYWQDIDDAEAIIISKYLSDSADVSEGDEIIILEVLGIGSYYKDSEEFRKHQEWMKEQEKERTEVS